MSNINTTNFSIKQVCPHRADVIYYRINQDWVDVMAILGSQDMDVWLWVANIQTMSAY